MRYHHHLFSNLNGVVLESSGEKLYTSQCIERYRLVHRKQSRELHTADERKSNANHHVHIN